MNKPVNILYIGNNLVEKTGYPSTMQLLSILLEREGHVVVKASDKLNVLTRMMHMLTTIIKHRKRTDIVLIDTYSTLNFYYAYFCAVLLRFLKLPYIPILHGGNLPQRLKKSPLLSKAIFGKAFVNIAPSNYLYEVFRQQNFKTICIPNTLETEQYPFKERTQYAPKLLYVRSFAGIYNPKMAIKVLFELKKSYPKAQLCMVGPDRDGTLNEVKDLVNRLQLEDAVEFTGVLTKAAWHKKSEGFDVFINTSNVDNMPVSLLEAMALGLAVVTTNVGGIKYLIKDTVNGILVNPDDEMAMANAIKHLIENGAITMVRKARAEVEALEWDKVKHKWNRLLTGV